MATLNSNLPAGPLAAKWEQHKLSTKLINPANKRKYKIIVVGAGLAGASASATLAELGYEVQNFVFHDSPRRAHSVAAQGGINAAKNYQNDGDSVHRLFYDTIKGGDFRAREANVHRLAEVSVNIIDQCVAQGVPFAREYGGLLDNRSFGGAQVSRTFYARGQTGQQLLLGAYSALKKMIAAGGVNSYTHAELQAMLPDLPGGAGQPGADLPPLSVTTLPQRLTATVGGPMAAVRAGAIREIAPADAAALELLGAIISDRLAMDLRETRGLSYSVGASLQILGDRGVFTTWLNPPAERLAEGEQALVDFLRAFDAAAITQEELDTVRSARQGRLLMRRLDSINRAYQLAMAELDGDVAAYLEALTALDGVTLQDLRRVEALFFSELPLILVVVQ